MGTQSARGAGVRVTCFAAGGPFAIEALTALAAEHLVALVVRPAEAGPWWRRGARAVARAARLRPEDAVEAWARARGIPTIDLAAVPSRAQLAALHDAAADVAGIATFPFLLTREVREAAAPRCVNVHPSLLPRHRGAGALFWTYHAGDAHAGVTVHEAVDAFDAGPVVAQVALPVARGESIVDVHRRCAVQGGALLARIVAEIRSGTSRPRQQDETLATRAPAPRVSRVRSLLPEWDAAHAFHFLAGVLPIYLDPFTDVDGQAVPYGRVEGFETRASREAPGRVVRDGAGWAAWTRDGVVHLAPAHTRERLP